MTDSVKGVAGLGLAEIGMSRTLLQQGQGLDLQREVAKLKERGSANPENEAEAEKAAEQFEALLVQQMFKAMWSTVPDDGLLSGSREEELYQDMFQEELAKEVSSGQGLGIKEVLLKELTSKGSNENP